MKKKQKCTNRHYKRGYTAERLAVKKLEGDGYVAIRSGGSKKIDIVAFARVGGGEKEWIGIVRAIMVTRNRTKEKNKKDRGYIKGLPLPTIVSKELWTYTPRKGFKIEAI